MWPGVWTCSIAPCRQGWRATERSSPGGGGWIYALPCSRAAEAPWRMDATATRVLISTAGYLNHLFKAKELLGLRLATIHNLRFVMRLMADMRAAIAGGSFDLFAREFLEGYRPADEAARLEQSRRWLASRSRGG